MIRFNDDLRSKKEWSELFKWPNDREKFFLCGGVQKFGAFQCPTCETENSVPIVIRFLIEYWTQYHVTRIGAEMKFSLGVRIM